MGCAGSNAEKAGQTPAAPVEKSIDLTGLNETEKALVKTHPNTVIAEGDHYMLKQIFAFVRHGDRLDHTKEWKNHDDYKVWINDTPLTESGHEHAKVAGEGLKKLSEEKEVPFDLIVASPYYRCAQTASQIAKVLGVPIHFDIDLGEVFDNVSMKGENLQGKQQFKPPKELTERLRKDFPDVKYITDSDGTIKYEGKLQKFPEDFEAARMRYAYKTKKLLQKGAAEQMSICIVSHGDGVASVVGMLREDWQIQEVPYTAYVFGYRKVKVLKKGTEEIIKEEPVYLHPGEWELRLDTAFQKKVKKITNAAERKEAHVIHEQEVKQMNAVGKKIQTEYTLDDDQVEAYKAALGQQLGKYKAALDHLDHLGGDDDDHHHMLHKAASSHHMNNSERIKCHPDHVGVDHA